MRSSFREAVVPPRRWPLPPPTPALLQSGGDQRLICDPITGLTPYGSAATPQPDSIGLSSCTASSISEEGFAAAEQARRHLAQASLDGDVGAELQRQGAQIRAAIARHFFLPEGAEVVLAASGTDAELLAVALAAPPGRPVVNVLVAPDESGSGVPYAAAGRHFAEITATGRPAGKGVPVAGFPALTLHTIPGRDASGAVRPSDEIIAAYRDAIETATAGGGFVLPHLLDGSKTGYVLPDPTALRRLVRQYPDTVRVIVDACQGRDDPVRVARWLHEGWIVLVTGSKFYGGPPFSGAVLLPPALVSDLAAGPLRLPEGLEAYSTRADWPDRLAPSRDLPEPGNPGLLLRWQAALVSMAEYRGMPRTLRRTRLTRFAAALPRLISERRFLRLVATPVAADVIPTIFSFAVLLGDEQLGLADARRVHRWLNADLSTRIAKLPASQSWLAGRRCLIGQPVALPHAAVLRIASGARRGAARVADAKIALDKIALILKHWEALRARE